jgi:hypothetical protein
MTSKAMKRELRAAGWRFVRTTNGGGHEMWESEDGAHRHVTDFARKEMDNRAVAELTRKIAASMNAGTASGAVTPRVLGHSYMAVPGTSRGPLSWSLLRRMVQIAPPDLWASTPEEARELGECWYDEGTYLRLMRVPQSGQPERLQARLSDKWVEDPTGQTGPGDKAWSIHARYFADWAQKRGTWRVYKNTKGKRKEYMQTFKGDRALVLAHLSCSLTLTGSHGVTTRLRFLPRTPALRSSHRLR